LASVAEGGVEMTAKFGIVIHGAMLLEPKFFWDDSPVNEHEDATELDCAREVSRYIEAHGLSMWLREWNLDDIDVYVGEYPAVLQGVPIKQIVDPTGGNEQ